jgi:bifunctional oligoribonuclease and PAP phosphatase NrnA
MVKRPSLNEGTDMQDTFQQMIDALATKQRVLITTHIRPDGDALGSTAALSVALRKLGIASEVLLLSHLPTKYAFIYRDNNIHFHDAEEGWPEALSFNRFDALLIADTGTWSQLPGLDDRLPHLKGPKLVLDHHLTQEDWADIKLVDTRAAAAAEIVAELLERWDIELDQSIATALYLGIVSDTGWFQHSNTRPETMRLTARLMEAGVDTDAMYQRLYQNERAERLTLQTRAMQSMELLADGKLSVMRLGPSDFTDTRAGVPSTEGLINIPLQIATVQVSILIIESPDPGPVRVSLRSKGQVDCARFAEQFGGGGHARAAGLKLPPPMDAVHRTVVDAMLASLSKPA